MPLVFRASRTTVALLRTYPPRISQFELYWHGAATGPTDAILRTQVPRSIYAPAHLTLYLA